MRMSLSDDESLRVYASSSGKTSSERTENAQSPTYDATKSLHDILESRSSDSASVCSSVDEMRSRTAVCCEGGNSRICLSEGKFGSIEMSDVVTVIVVGVVVGAV